MSDGQHEPRRELGSNHAQGEEGGEDPADGRSGRVQDDHAVPVRRAAQDPDGAGGATPYPDGSVQGTLPGVEDPFDKLFQGLNFSSASYSGPILPEHLRQYDVLVPGAAAEIISATIIAPERRLDKLTDAEVETAKNGQSWAGMLSLICVVAAIVFFAIGKEIAGGAFLSFPVVMLVGAFLRPTMRSKQNDDKPKRKADEGAE